MHDQTSTTTTQVLDGRGYLCYLHSQLMSYSYEAWHDQKPKVDHMRIFGCLAYAHVPSQQQTKFDAKAVQCIFIGYSPDNEAYKLFNPATDKVIISRDIIFDKNLINPMTNFHKHNYADGDIFEGLLPGLMYPSYSIANPHLQQGRNFLPTQVFQPSTSVSTLGESK